MAMNNGELDWNATIEDDGSQGEFVLLDEGDYNFTVSNLTKGRSQGGGKLPACNMAKLTLNIDTADGKTAHVLTNLVLHASLEWKLSSFFRSLGFKKHGEKLVMDWNKVIGSEGRAHIKQVKGTKDPDKLYNEVEYFIDYKPEDHMIKASNEDVPF